MAEAERMADFMDENVRKACSRPRVVDIPILEVVEMNVAV